MVIYSNKIKRATVTIYMMFQTLKEREVFRLTNKTDNRRYLFGIADGTTRKPIWYHKYREHEKG